MPNDTGERRLVGSFVGKHISKEKEEIENELKRLINNNYIFNIRICKNYGTLMFSVILEKNNKRATIGLKYDDKNNIANVVTLF